VFVDAVNAFEEPLFLERNYTAIRCVRDVLESDEPQNTRSPLEIARFPGVHSQKVLSVIPIRWGKYHEQEMLAEVRKARHVDLCGLATVAFVGGSRVTHRIMQMTNSNVQTSSGLVSFCVMNQHRLQAILESDQLVLAVILLRPLDRFVIDPMSGGLRRNLQMPILSIVRNADVEERCREHRETIGREAHTRDGGDGRKDRARFRKSEERWHN
jgi:hypothetical protein